MYKKITQIITKIKSKKMNISIAESCTGGMLAQYITSISGSSKVFTFGVVTYSNQSKIKYLNVPHKIIHVANIPHAICGDNDTEMGSGMIDNIKVHEHRVHMLT